MSRSKDAVRGGRWRNVTRAKPCPVCGRHSWCSVLDDGRVVMCRRDSSGKHETDRNGDDFWLHFDDAHAPREQDITPPHTAVRASVDVLDIAYRAAVTALRLSPSHRRLLRARGLTDEEIDRRQYRTLPVPGRAKFATRIVAAVGSDVAPTIPGLQWKADGERGYWSLRGAAGIVIPVRDLEGRIVALKIRRDGEPNDHARYTYVSSNEHGGPSALPAVHHPLCSMLGNETRRDEIRITEGELKADIASALTGTLTLSIPGVGSWRRGVDAVQPIAPGRVLIAFDADVRTNKHVRRAETEMSNALALVVDDVAIESWPADAGNGFDDVLAANRGDDVRSVRVKRPSAAAAVAYADVTQTPEPERPRVRSLADHINALGSQGIHLRSGFGTLDKCTRGGFRVTDLVIAGGAPGAAKTTLSVNLLFNYASGGIPCVYLCADESPTGIVTRIGQLCGFQRDALESADPESIAHFREMAADTLANITLIDADADHHTIESAGDALREIANDGPRVLFVDSLQTVRSNELRGDETDKGRLDVVVRSLKRIAADGSLVVALSELNRGAYRSRDSAQATSAIAAFKESGAIEYGAPFAFVLRSVPGESSVFDAEVAKNRIGTDKPSFRLSLDVGTARMIETSVPPEASLDDRQRDREARDERVRNARMEKATDAVLDAVRKHPNLQSANAICAVTEGRRPDLLKAVSALESHGLLVRVDRCFRVAPAPGTANDAGTSSSPETDHATNPVEAA